MQVQRSGPEADEIAVLLNYVVDAVVGKQVGEKPWSRAEVPVGTVVVPCSQIQSREVYLVVSERVM